MPRKYQKVPKATKRVSFDDSAGVEYDAPRTSYDARQRDSPYHAPAFNKEEEDGDDEIDTLLAEDPLFEEKAISRSRSSSGKLTKRQKRLIFAGISVLLLGLIALITVLGLKSHSNNKSHSTALTGDAKTQSDDLALEEVNGLSEVPTLVGIVPISGISAPNDENQALEPGQVISVPTTDSDYDNEATDKAAYEAEAALDDGSDEDTSDYNDPPELSPEAVAQTQNVNGKLEEQGASISDLASQITPHRDPLESMRSAANDILAWLRAQWADMTSNSPDSNAVVY